jgi:hypothetical protein
MVLKAFTALNLLTMEFPPTSYTVEGLIPEGLSVLAGRPKIGKPSPSTLPRAYRETW